jgi:hypothetical protein
MKASHSASALLGAAALGLVLFTVSAAQQSTQLSGGSLAIRNLEVLVRKPVRIDVEFQALQGPMDQPIFTVPHGKTLVIENSNGSVFNNSGVWSLSSAPISQDNGPWRHVIEDPFTAGGPSHTIGVSLVFREGEVVYLGTNGGGTANWNLTLSGYLMDA